MTDHPRPRVQAVVVPRGTPLVEVLATEEIEPVRLAAPQDCATCGVGPEDECLPGCDAE